MPPRGGQFEVANAFSASEWNFVRTFILSPSGPSGPILGEEVPISTTADPTRVPCLGQFEVGSRWIAFNYAVRPAVSPLQHGLACGSEQ